MQRLLKLHQILRNMKRDEWYEEEVEGVQHPPKKTGKKRITLFPIEGGHQSQCTHVRDSFHEWSESFSLHTQKPILKGVMKRT